MSITGNLNLPVTRKLLAAELCRIRGLLLEAKYGRETDLSLLEIDLAITNIQRLIGDLETITVKVLGFKG